ncbi:hypothetical protein D6833_10430 [Candidatus Parcubacteria bacterium]|nr:MAG: hypothetical protein D6833_10430 [Candidatus Parcubacteria bacterium]
MLGVMATIPAASALYAFGPVVFEGGNYVFGLRPTQVWLKYAIHGLTGAGSSAAGNLTAQLAFGRGRLPQRWRAADWGDVGIAGGTGFFSGGASGWASSSAGTGVMGGLANGVQYLATQLSNRKPINVGALAVSIASGGAAGAFVGPAPRAGEIFDESGMWLDQTVARRLNALADLKSIGWRDFWRSLIGGVIGNVVGH